MSDKIEAKHSQILKKRRMQGNKISKWYPDNLQTR